MTTSSPLTFDFNPLAAKFDRFLPQIEPVGRAVLDRLGALAGGARVIDVACGTGEPGLTLARRAPGVALLGVDQAEGLIAVARAKAQHEGLAHARFAVGSMEALPLEDAGADAVISRFGLLMFGDVAASARELARVVRPGGALSLAVWDEPADNTLMGTLTAVLRGYLPPGRPSTMDALRAWAGETRRAKLLAEVGFSTQTELLRWDYRFASFDEPWDMVSGMATFTGQAELDAAAQAQVRAELEAKLVAYRAADGSYAIPHACRLIWGTRAAS